jgi:ABC-type transport system substrate-binding protein
VNQGWYRVVPGGSLLLLILAVLTACTTMPPPPLVQPPTSTPPPTSRQPKPTEVDVGIDSLAGGFNPHTLADLSPTTLELASLVLPSVFRPGQDGTPRLDTTLMESADVVPGASQFTIRYRIRKEAEWSDGTPIAAEDFVYLWQELRSQPGASDAAGYQLISNVASRQGGKTVEVTFSRPFPGWQTLFANLLPAHLLRDTPRGFADALDNGYPASGGPFGILQVDRGRGEITLDRNDRYWGTPAVTDRIVLRASDQPGQVAALNSGASNLAVFTADAGTAGRLRTLGDSVQVSTLAQPITMQVLLRPSSPQLADVRVRSAILSALDPRALTDVGSGGGPSVQLPDHALILSPTEPGYTPTEPADMLAANPARVGQLLTGAGYQFTAGSWVRDNRPLSVVIAAPFERKDYVAVAQAAARQLAQQGIQATVVTPTGDQLFNQPTSANAVSGNTSGVGAADMIVAPKLAGQDPASMLAASFGCPGVTPDGQRAEPPNPDGYCDALLQPTVEAGLSGAIPFAELSSKAEPYLWSQAIALPLYQQAQVVAVRAEVRGVRNGPGFTGPFFSATQWVGFPSDSPGY